MASIEDRIVKIQFDNSLFEQKLASTIASIEKLNSTLATAGSRNGLETIKTSASNFNLSHMHGVIDGVSAKFLAMSTIAVTALSTIVSHAITAGIQITKALSLDPVTSGFREYELGIGSIQTILANTSADGTGLEDVNAALDELNEYSDKTIYNFGEMTRNIGTFTAAGVDLDTSVLAIKGIANVAAISGSSSEQAATAMYQLSQAVANGSVKLMDWNSVVNAGMGGEVFQKALFETGVAMGTIADAPVGTTFEEWTAAGNSFRGSLEDGWLTADVLTTTLGAFTGEMTEAQLTALGYTQEQAQEMMRLGELGVDSATKVRTLTQLLNTSKEALQSGWAQSFEIIFGDFEEATALFTGISDAIGGMIGRSADARNALLQDWKDLGGRTLLIDGLKNVFLALGDVLRPIKDAFRDIFPAKTAMDLFTLTAKFRDFAEGLRLSEDSIIKVRAIFRGLFSALEIGWTIIKEGTKFVKDLIASFIPSGAGGTIVDFLKNLGDALTYLDISLVMEGGIARFFDNLSASIQRAIQYVKDLAKSFIGLFDNLALPSGMGDIFENVGEGLSDAVGGVSGAGAGIGNLWEPFKSALSTVGDILEETWDVISSFFSGLGDKLADVFSAPDFDSILAVLDTALLGGIVALLAKLVGGGGLFSSFGGGIFTSISGAFGELTGTLKAMQADLRASALLKIAAAIGILAVSLLLLSTIESEKMSDALAALALAFGFLIGAFAALDKLSSGITSGATFVLIAGGMMLLAGAVLILTASIKILSMLSWEELAKGLVGVAGAMAIMVGAALLLQFAKGSLISAGIGMLFIATSMAIMAGAVKLFSMMDWEEMGRGLAGVAGALVAIALGMKFMPNNLLLTGAGLILVGVALNIIAGAMHIMAALGWEEIGKGLTVIGGALGLIAAATYFMSPLLPLVGAGLILVAISLGMIVGVMELLSNMSWEDIGKGLAGIAGALLAIAIAMAIANSGVLGAAGIIGVAFALTILMEVMTKMASMSWGEIIRGVGGIALVLGVLAISALLLAPAVLPLLGLGAALVLIGGGFALFGLGVMGVAKAIQLLVEVGPKGIEAMVEAFEAFGSALPGLLEDIGEGILQFVDTLLEGMPKIIEGLVEVLSGILDGLIELIPKAGELISTLVKELLRIIRDYFPDLVKTGFEMLVALLTGFRDNIGQIAVLVSEIIINFLDALATQIPGLIDAVFNFIVALWEGVIGKMIDVGQMLAPKGLEFLKGLLEGAKEFLPTIGAWFQELPGNIVEFLGDAASWLLEKGGQLIEGLKNGAVAAWEATLEWFKGLPELIKTGIGELLDLLTDIGGNVIDGLKTGAETSWELAVEWFKGLPQLIRTAIGRLLELLTDIGGNVINGLKTGAVAAWELAVEWFKGLPQKIRTGIGALRELLGDIGGNVIDGLKKGALAAWDIAVEWFKDLPQKIRTAIGALKELLSDIGGNVIDGLKKGALAAWAIAVEWFKDLPQKIRTAIGALRELLDDIGGNVINGLKNGAVAAWTLAVEWFKDIPQKIRTAIGGLRELLGDIGGNVINGLKTGAETAWGVFKTWLVGIPQEIRTAIGSLRTLLEDIGANILRSLKNGAANVLQEVKDWFTNAASGIKDAVLGFFGIGSPSKVFIQIGGWVMEGLQIGLEDEWDRVARWLHHINPADNLKNNMADRMNAVVSDLAKQFEEMDEFNPVITPVLDLTRIQAGAKDLSRMIPANSSYLQAAAIARSTNSIADVNQTVSTAGSGKVTFEQNIYAPEQLSTADIYRQTRNQIAMAKEELKIP